MKKIIFVILILLFSFNCYALTKEEAYETKTYLFIQGKSAEKTNDLFEKLNQGLVYAGFAFNKVRQFAKDYRAETEPAPGVAQKLDALMNDYFKATEQYFEALKANDTRNAPQFKRNTEELYRNIKREAGQVKLKIQ